VGLQTVILKVWRFSRRRGWIHSPRSVRAGIALAGLGWLTVLTSLVSVFDLGLVNLLSNLADDEAEANVAQVVSAGPPSRHGGWDVTGGYNADLLTAWSP
jgi:hypothetical protein